MTDVPSGRLHAERIQVARVQAVTVWRPRRRRGSVVDLWFAEAGANGAFPLVDRSAIEIFVTPRPVLSRPRNRYVYYQNTAEVLCRRRDAARG